MKKYGVLVVLAMFCLTGCGNNRLVCTMENSGTNYEMSQKYTFTFAKDKITKATMQTTTILKEDLNTEENIDMYYQTAQSAADEYNAVEGIEAKASTRQNRITLSVEMKSAAMSEDDKEEYLLNESREETKKILEESEEGFTCK